MLCMYMEDAITYWISLEREGDWFKNFKCPWRGWKLLRIFNYQQSVHWWCPYFILHNCVGIVWTLSVSTCGFSWGKMLVLGGISLGLKFPWDSCWSTLGGGGSYLCMTGWPRQLLLVFLSESVIWTRLGYFLTNGTTLHWRVESGACIFLSIIDLNCRKSWWLIC